MFTFSTFKLKGWAHNRDRIRINDSNLSVTTLAVIAAISEEHCLIDYIVHPKAINSEVFLCELSSSQVLPFVLCPTCFLSSLLSSLGAHSRFANFFFSRSFCGLCNLADSFIKKIPIPGFSTSMSSNNLLE
jgi:hypothetical protein